ncbi:hypothetical protein, partial [Bifidobacterium vansinderenii]|uniref:hypothetical protein n=1 Tax=Bifidobacterium vansinderenii TaxID=1984871 RepID=UPI001E4010D1
QNSGAHKSEWLRMVSEVGRILRLTATTMMLCRDSALWSLYIEPASEWGPVFVCLFEVPQTPAW